PGARELLTGLHADGVPQAIGSSAPRGNIELILEVLGIADVCEVVVGMEDKTRGKPDPEVFLVAAKRLGAKPSRWLVFEDAVAGVQAAKAGGMKCIAVRFVGHHGEDALRAAGADRVLGSLGEVSVADVLKLLQ